MTSSKLTTDEQDELIVLTNEADISCPEMVCDAVLKAANESGFDAGLEVLASAIETDNAEQKALGII